MDSTELVHFFKLYFSATLTVLRFPLTVALAALQFLCARLLRIGMLFPRVIEMVASAHFRLCGLTPLTIDLDNQTTVHFWTSDHRRHDWPNLVMIHGYGGNARLQFFGQICSLSRKFNLYMPDLLFFGKSYSKRSDRTEVFQATCMVEGLRRLGVDRFSVYSISYGGFVAYRMAEMYPEKVEKVVIASTGVGWSDDVKREMLGKIGRDPKELLLPENPHDLRLLLSLTFYKRCPLAFPWLPDLLLQQLIDALGNNHRKEKLELLDYLLNRKEDKELPILTQCIYNEWKGFLGWASDIRAIFGRSWREQESISLRMVPFILVEGGRWPQSNYVIVNMDGSRHPLPLITVYHQLQPIDANPYTFLQALFGHEYPVGLLDEEKILPLGKDISAVGTCCSKDGIPEIKSCKDLPYFLSDMTKDQMVSDLSFKSKILLWSGIVLGSMSIGILGYAAVRNWNKWKEWRQQRQSQQPGRAASDRNGSWIDVDEEVGDVPDGQLCVICLMRRRRSAFIPCGHLVCCQLCAISVEREASPKCPLCRQEIRNSVRIFEG